MQGCNRTVRSTETAGSPVPDPEQALGALPSWNLDALYPGPNSAELAGDLERARLAAAAFQQQHCGRLALLSGADLGRAVAEYEQIQEILARLRAYAELLFAADTGDSDVARLFQTVQERTNAIGSEVLFFPLELTRIDDEALDAKLAAAELAPYRSWLCDLRAFRPHRLSDEVETVLFEKELAGRTAWRRLYDETRAAWRFAIGGRDLTLPQARDLLNHPDRKQRLDAADAIATTLGQSAPVLALALNTLARDKAVEDRRRGFARPISARNLANAVEDEVVDALIGAVKAAYPRLSHRYWRLKAKWLGLEKLEDWDRTAPLPGAAEQHIPWDRARRIVLDSYDAFSPYLAAIGSRFFAEARIDAGVRPGKRAGAFTHSTVPAARPYILLNYLGHDRDVMTLAHELGHGIHQVLAGRHGVLMAETPLTLAETSAVFGEMLTFRALLAAEADPERRRLILARKIEAMLHNVVRQIAFAEFERRFHDARRAGELNPAQIGELWRETQEQSLGDAVRLGPGAELHWISIWHFVHEPFYVYAYAFGECLATSLYAVYQTAPSGFADRYTALLTAGGTLRHRELLQPFGLDAADPAFWDRGLGVIGGFIDEIEAIGDVRG
jgi:oligoendopeptidase F